MPKPTPALERTFTPWRLRALELPHRVVAGSMHTGLETLDDGGVALAAYYAERVRGGASLLITGGLAVNPEGCGAHDFSVLGDPAGDARFAHAAAAVHEAGGFLAAQLFHAGRYALLEGVTDAEGRPVHPVAPSPLPWRAAGASVPVELDEEGIARTIADFGRAAARAVELGFDAVEIMASEGYLINQFCSPVTNRRDDGWGGDAVRRQRFAVEVLREVRQAVGFDVPVIVRLSGADLVPGSTTPEETAALARALVRAGADALNVGIGWHESRVPTVQAAVPHGAWLGYAEAVAEAVSLPGDPSAPTAVPVIASNRLTDLRDVEAVLAGGRISAVALARPFLADAAIVGLSREGRFHEVNSCIGCNQACLDRSFTMQPVSCLVNPRAANEWRYPLPASVVREGGSGSGRRRVAVVGGGPAGLVAAADLAERGVAVTLFEAAPELGGQFRLAARIPTKEDYALTVDHYRDRLARLGAEVRLGHAADADELAAAGYDSVVVATGVRPRTLDIEGATLPHVLSYERAIDEGVPEGRVAIIGGGGIGVDVTKLLVLPGDPAVRARAFARHHGLPEAGVSLEGAGLPQRARVRASVPRPGEQVTLLRRTGKFGAGMGITSRWVALGELRDAGVRFASDLAYERITPSGVEVLHADGRRELIAADTVIVCAGQVSHDPLSARLAELGVSHERVGGALDATRVDAVRATRQALDAARRPA
ncbi:NADPH-dependent 2,4-dienoyl-CoA reductase [Herbiconiux moechotypicola]|uniref:NADPH-dependent 2,4-dienoyl-CoA reductase n=1 Tax=Herbiconiux moechotypicola TaxID=637393 RepID=A0ABN3DYZ5_9MICO|nr:FAD-dependent oxidoreductase [Herbiconiux moechotypicola]